MMDNSYKSGFVSIIGRPNVGKSTLMNRLIGTKIAITSNKPQTTRNKIRTVLTTDEGQVVFVDTPGIHKPKNKLGNFMVNASKSTFSDVDLLLYLIEPSDYVGEAEESIIEELGRTNIPVILVVNKIDKIVKEELLPIIDKYSKLYNFAEIMPVSALKGKGTDELTKLIFKYLPYGIPMYDEDTLTDQPERAIVSELVREAALKSLSDEVPHGIAVLIDTMKYRKNRDGNICDIEATIVCERDSHKGMIIGKGGSMIKKIGTSARYGIERLLDCHVNLKLFVKVKKDWRDSDFLVKNFGYDPKSELNL